MDQRGRGVPGGNGELPAVFWRLAAVMVPNRLGMFVAPFLTYYLAAGLHLGAGRVAIVMTAFGAGWAAGPPVAGHLADRLGRRGVIVATQVAAAAAYYGLGQARTLPQLAGGAVAVGLLFDGWRAPATAMVYDACAGQAQQARAMTRLFWMQNVGLIGSSVGAGVLAVTAGWQWLFAGNAIASVVFAAASWLAPQPELADAAEPAWHHAAAALSCAHPVASADATAPREAAPGMPADRPRALREARHAARREAVVKGRHGRHSNYAGLGQLRQDPGRQQNNAPPLIPPSQQPHERPITW